MSYNKIEKLKIRLSTTLALALCLLLTTTQTAWADKAAEVPSRARYFALIIGIDDYQYLPKLKTSVNDAKAVDKVLREQYGFKTTLLINSNRKQIIDELDKAQRYLGPDDNLLIYYSGHGECDEERRQAFWQPADARPDDETNWITLDRIADTLWHMEARHVLVVVNNCYLRTITRNFYGDHVDYYGDNIKNMSGKEYLAFMNKNASRTLMASGGNEPVPDGGGQGHFLFAGGFLTALKNPGVDVFTAWQLFYGRIKETVAGSAPKVPVYKIMERAGHMGGDFVFRKIK